VKFELGNMILAQLTNTKFIIIQMFKHCELSQIVSNYTNQTQKAKFEFSDIVERH